MRRIKKDDMVEIIAGKDNGKQGKVLSFDPKTNNEAPEADTAERTGWYQPQGSTD